MRVYDNGIYRDETEEERALRESVVGEHLISIHERVAALEKSQGKYSEVVLLAANWTGYAEPYSQVVEVNGVTANSKVDLQPTAAQILELQNEDIAFMTENNDGIITVYATGGKPVSDYTMQASITEVVPV